MCGEIWLAVKDSLTHRPSSQGWAPRVLLPCCVVWCCMFVFMSLTLGAHAQRGLLYWSCVCLCHVSLCVCLLSHISLLERLFVLKILSRTQRAMYVKIFVGFSETAPFKSYGVKHKRKRQLLIRSGLPVIRYSCSMYSEAPAVTA